MKRIPIPRKQKFPSDRFLAVDIKLKDGRIIRDLLLEEGTTLAGKIVGGHTGVEEVDFDFSAEDILEIKLRGSVTSLPFIERIKDRLKIL